MLKTSPWCQSIRTTHELITYSEARSLIPPLKYSSLKAMGSSQFFEHELPILAAWSLRINAVLSFTITGVSWTNGPKSRFNNTVNVFPFHLVLVPWCTESLQSPEDNPPSHSLLACRPGSTSSEPFHPSQKLSQALIPRDMPGSFRFIFTDSPYLVSCLLHISHRIVHCLFMCLSAPLSWILPESRGFILADLWYLTKSLVQSLCSE